MLPPAGKDFGARRRAHGCRDGAPVVGGGVVVAAVRRPLRRARGRYSCRPSPVGSILATVGSLHAQLELAVFAPDMGPRAPVSPLRPPLSPPLSHPADAAVPIASRGFRPLAPEPRYAEPLAPAPAAALASAPLTVGWGCCLSGLPFIPPSPRSCGGADATPLSRGRAQCGEPSRQPSSSRCFRPPSVCRRTASCSCASRATANPVTELEPAEKSRNYFWYVRSYGNTLCA
jgi:hypothetical protein